MNELIASFLIQNGRCRLSGIGKFEMQVMSAVSDVASKVIYPPETNYSFTEGSDYTSEELIAYCAYKTNVDIATAATAIRNWLYDVIHKLNRGEAILFPAIGKLVKNDEDIIVFISGNPPVRLQPVSADRVVHENDRHKVLVGDVESDSEKMNRLLHPDTKPIVQKWWKAAIILLVITVVLYLIYVISGGIGFHVQDAPATYISK